MRASIPAGPAPSVGGAGPIGRLAALVGVHQGHDVHVVDQVTDGPKPGLAAGLGATYHSTPIAALAALATTAD